MQVNMLEAKNRLSELVKCAQAGEEVIIANRGRPVMRLVPITDGAESDLPKDCGAELVKWLQARDGDTPNTPFRSTAEIEADIQDMRDAWD